MNAFVIKSLCSNIQCMCSEEAKICISIDPFSSKENAEACMQAIMASKVLERTGAKIVTKTTRVENTKVLQHSIRILFFEETVALQKLQLSDLSNIVRRTIGVTTSNYDMTSNHINDDKLAYKREKRYKSSKKYAKSKKASDAANGSPQDSSDSSDTETMDYS